MTHQETVSEDTAVEAAGPAEAEQRREGETQGASQASADDRNELLRRAVFAEQALELSRYVQDEALLKRLRKVITGQSEAELTEKLDVLKEVLVHIKERDGNRSDQRGLEEMVADEVKRNLSRLNSASQEVDARVGGPGANEAPTEQETASARLRRLARARGIIIR